MSKELPYFKFFVTEWMNGSITLESMEVQGLFINVCAHYWFRSGNLPLSELKRRLSKIKPVAFTSLLKSGLMVVKKDKIKIKFLDEQLAERDETAKTNSVNGSLGGRPKKATALFSESETKAKRKPIREEKNKKREREDFSLNSQIASLLNKPYSLPIDRGMEAQGQDMDGLIKQLRTNFDMSYETISARVVAMKAVYQINKWSFPSNYITLLSAITESDWEQKLRELNPEFIAENIEKAKNGTKRTVIDDIGSSAPGSLG